jgi:hypothetical protein
MDTETIGSTEKEQEWIRKYRAALDLPSRKSRLKAVGATFGKLAKVLVLAIRSVLAKRASTPVPVVSAQATKMILVPISTMSDQSVQGSQSLVVKSVPPENIFRLDAEVPDKAS